MRGYPFSFFTEADAKEYQEICEILGPGSDPYFGISDASMLEFIL